MLGWCVVRDFNSEEFFLNGDKLCEIISWRVFKLIDVGMVLELYSSSKDIIVKFNFCSELGNYNRNFLLVDDVEVIVCLKIDIES